MKQQTKEQRRTLTPREQERLKHFEEMAAGMEAQGYRRKELTVGIVRANVFACVFAIPVFLVGFVLFFLRNNGAGRWIFDLGNVLILIVCTLCYTVMHELIHGFTWSLFAEHHFQDIEFGFMKQYLTPYCTCTTPLAKGPYILGTLMPLIVLGLLPTALGILSGIFLLLLLGLIMITAAGGDVLIALKLLTFRSSAKEIVYIDHPTQAGCVIFER